MTEQNIEVEDVVDGEENTTKQLKSLAEAHPFLVAMIISGLLTTAIIWVAYHLDTNTEKHFVDDGVFSIVTTDDDGGWLVRVIPEAGSTMRISGSSKKFIRLYSTDERYIVDAHSVGVLDGENFDFELSVSSEDVGQLLPEFVIDGKTESVVTIESDQYFNIEIRDSAERRNSKRRNYELLWVIFLIATGVATYIRFG